MNYFKLISLIFISICYNMDAQTIKFTNKMIYFDNPYIETSVSSFTDDNVIYAVAQQETSIINMPITDNPGTQVNLGFFVSIDGKPIVNSLTGSFATAVPGAMFSSLYNDVYSMDKLPFLLKVDENDRFKSAKLRQDVNDVFLNALNEKGIGKHKINVEIKFMDDGKISPPIASGGFEINVKKAFKVTKPSILPPAKMKDEKLTKSMIDALKKGGWDYEVIQLNIVEANWEIHKDMWAKITHRSIDTYVLFKKQDGNCKRFNISFKQMYTGGNYGVTQVNGTGSSDDVPCAK